MPIATRLDELPGVLPRVSYHWSTETEILSVHFDGAEPAVGYTGAIELEDPGGAVLTLDVHAGSITLLEVAVWPEVETEARLKPPRTDRDARFTFPLRISQPGVGVVEMDVPLAARRTPDDSVIHLRVGDGRPAGAVRVAENVVIETDDDGLLAGFWLLDVPPFPDTEAIR